MGQKVSPIGMRVGVIRDWESRWYADKAEFGDLLNEDIKIREFMEKKLKDAYISRIEIERAGKKNVKIIVRCARPGAMLGKDGDKDKMEVLNSEISKLTGGKKVRIDVIAVANPDLDARLVARKSCEQLEARQSFRIAQKKTIQQTMRSGAKGIKTLAKGRLGGAEIARSEGYSRGVVPLHTQHTANWVSKSGSAAVRFSPDRWSRNRKLPHVHRAVTAETTDAAAETTADRHAAMRKLQHPLHLQQHLLKEVTSNYVNA